jgi:hypothetical protein
MALLRVMGKNEHSPEQTGEIQTKKEEQYTRKTPLNRV